LLFRLFRGRLVLLFVCVELARRLSLEQLKDQVADGVEVVWNKDGRTDFLNEDLEVFTKRVDNVTVLLLLPHLHDGWQDLLDELLKIVRERLRMNAWCPFIRNHEIMEGCNVAEEGCSRRLPDPIPEVRQKASESLDDRLDVRKEVRLCAPEDLEEGVGCHLLLHGYSRAGGEVEVVVIQIVDVDKVILVIRIVILRLRGKAVL
jgi:hypothetical protein